MNNTRYPYPFIPVTGKVINGTSGPALWGDLKKLAGTVSVGIYDADTYSIASNSGNGKVFFVGYTSEHTKDFIEKYSFGKTDARGDGLKFRGDDVIKFEYSKPTKLSGEVWNIGYTGVNGCNEPNPAFECGKVYGVRVVASGSPVYERWAKSLTREFFSDPICCPNGDCNGTCPDFKINSARIYTNLAKKINTDVEAQSLGIKARVKLSDYTATAATITKYQLQVCDEGNGAALGAVQAHLSDSSVERTSRTGSISTYQVWRTALPAPFIPETSVALATCGVCPVGFTTVPGTDTYIISRPLAGTEDLTTAAAKATFATTVGGTYSATTSTFLSQNGSVAVIQIVVPTGTVVATLLSDVVTKSKSEGATCVPTAATAIAWTVVTTGYKGVRTLCISLNRKDCGGAVHDRLPELVALYANNPSVVPGSVVVGAAGLACRDSYQLQQYSDGIATDACLAKDTLIFNDFGGFEGAQWEEVPAPVLPYDPTKKAGLEITAELTPKFFSDCAFELDDYFEIEPIRLEVSWIMDSYTGVPGSCEVANLPKAVRIKTGTVANQIGEQVLREYIKAGVYENGSMDCDSPRMREVRDSNRRNQIDRKAVYRYYYLQVREFRESFNFHQKGEVWEIIFVVKEGDVARQAALEAGILAPLSKFGVVLKERK